MLGGDGKPLVADGDCFLNAFRYIVDQGIDNPHRKLTLVHATVTGTGGNAEGLDYAHAFVIERQDIPMDVYDENTYMIGDPFVEFAIDTARDYWNPTQVPLGLYRNIGRVKNEIHYTLKEARKLALESEIYGPWDDSVSTDVDRCASESKS